jgi:hypothetical protein
MKTLRDIIDFIAQPFPIHAIAASEGTGDSSTKTDIIV